MPPNLERIKLDAKIYDKFEGLSPKNAGILWVGESLWFNVSDTKNVLNVKIVESESKPIEFPIYKWYRTPSACIFLW